MRLVDAARFLALLGFHLAEQVNRTLGCDF